MRFACLSVFVCATIVAAGRSDSSALRKVIRTASVDHASLRDFMFRELKIVQVTGLSPLVEEALAEDGPVTSAVVKNVVPGRILFQYAGSEILVTDIFAEAELSVLRDEATEYLSLRNFRVTHGGLVNMQGEVTNELPSNFSALLHSLVHKIVSEALVSNF